MATYVFSATNLTAYGWYRMDTASGSSSPATIQRMDPATTIEGSMVQADAAGNVARFKSESATLYAKPVDYLGAVGIPVTLTGQQFPAPNDYIPPGSGTGGERITAASVGATYTANVATAEVFDLTLTANCTLSFTGAPAGGTVAEIEFLIHQDVTGARTITWPNSITWATDRPLLNSAANSKSRVTLWTVDGGTTWFGGSNVPPSQNLLAQSGPFSNRPPASQVPAGTKFFANDTDGGTEYRSNGSSWTQTAPSVNTGKAFRVVPAGTTDVEINAAIDSLGTDGGTIYLCTGQYQISSSINIHYNNVTIQGAGQYATKLIAQGDIIVIDMSGVGSMGGGAGSINNARKRIQLKDLNVDGGSNSSWNTQPMVRAWYGINYKFESVEFVNKKGVALDIIELQASTFWQCRWDGCGGAGVSQPAVLMRNGNTNTDGVFGFSGNTFNDLTFIRCQWETCPDGGVWMIGDSVTTSGTGANINFFECGWDNNDAVGSQFIARQCLQVRMLGCGSNISGGNAAWSTAIDNFVFIGCNEISIRDHTFLFGGSTAYSNCGFLFDGTTDPITSVSPGNTYILIDGITGSTNVNGPTNGLVKFQGTNQWVDIRYVAWRRNGGTFPTIVGAPLTSIFPGRLARTKAGVPADSDFNSSTPGSAIDGMGPVINTLTLQEYWRIGGTWQAVQGASPSGRGTLAARPAAAGTNTGYFYEATDVAGGTLYQSDGTTWWPAAPGVTAGGSPSLLGGHKRTGAVETSSRLTGLTASISTTSGRVIFSYFTPDGDTAITQIAYSTGAQAQSGATLIRFGLYTVDGSGNLALVARIASDTALFASTATEYIRSLDTTGGYPSSYNCLSATRYAFGVVSVGASTQAQLGGPTSMVSTAGNASPRIFGRLDSQTDLPTSVTAGSLINSLSGFYAAGLP